LNKKYSSKSQGNLPKWKHYIINPCFSQEKTHNKQQRVGGAVPRQAQTWAVSREITRRALVKFGEVLSLITEKDNAEPSPDMISGKV